MRRKTVILFTRGQGGSRGFVETKTNVTGGDADRDGEGKDSFDHIFKNR